jgi:hypothetical protein
MKKAKRTDFEIFVGRGDMVSREEPYELVWSIPMTKAAKK